MLLFIKALHFVSNHLTATSLMYELFIVMKLSFGDYRSRGHAPETRAAAEALPP